MREPIKSTNFALPKKNFLYIVIGVIVLIIGFILMSGGGTEDPNIFPQEEIFSFRRITLAPLFILAGFAIEIFALLYIPKSER
ncbi:MAG: DUF3098 domain-containing protein [Bacteroidales bacterium]